PVGAHQAMEVLDDVTGEPSLHFITKTLSVLIVAMGLASRGTIPAPPDISINALLVGFMNGVCERVMLYEIGSGLKLGHFDGFQCEETRPRTFCHDNAVLAHIFPLPCGEAGLIELASPSL